MFAAVLIGSEHTSPLSPARLMLSRLIASLTTAAHSSSLVGERGGGRFSWQVLLLQAVMIERGGVEIGRGASGNKSEVGFGVQGFVATVAPEVGCCTASDASNGPQAPWAQSLPQGAEGKED